MAWRKTTNDDAEGLQDALHDALRNVPGEVDNLWTCRYRKVSDESTVPELARHLVGVGLARHVELKSYHAQEEQGRMQFERQGMEIADIESRALAVYSVVERARGINQSIFARCSKIKEVIPMVQARYQAKVARQAREAREARDREMYRINSATPTEEEDTGRSRTKKGERLEAANVKEASECLRIRDITGAEEHELKAWAPVYTGVASVVREFAPELRIISELQRQHCERHQEALDLRARLQQARNPFSLYLGRRRHLAEGRLQRLQLVRERLAGAALVELQEVQRWMLEASGAAAEKLDDFPNLPPVLRLKYYRFLEAFGVSHLDGLEVEGPGGARALWSLTAAVWALGAYLRTELADLPPAHSPHDAGEFKAAMKIDRVCALDKLEVRKQRRPAPRTSREARPAPWVNNDVLLAHGVASPPSDTAITVP
jgi:hypothetical protein